MYCIIIYYYFQPNQLRVNTVLPAEESLMCLHGLGTMVSRQTTSLAFLGSDGTLANVLEDVLGKC